MSRINLRALLVIAGCLIAFQVLSVASAYATDLTVACTAPTKFTDGTSIPAGTTITYNLYGALQGQSKVLLTPTPLATCQSVRTSVKPGTQCYEATAIIGGIESAHTLETCVAVAAPAPQPPGQPTVTVSAIAPTAYSVIKSDQQLVLLPVGTVPLGTACDTSQGVVKGTNVFNVVSTKAVTFSGTARPLVVLASCG